MKHKCGNNLLILDGRMGRRGIVMENGVKKHIMASMRNKLMALSLAAVLVNAVFVSMIATDFANVMEEASADIGGPDSFGYRWTDSNMPSPIIGYNWIEINNTGTDSGIIGDDNNASIPIGFIFPFYGVDYNSINISTNGYIDFGLPNTVHDEYDNDNIPNTNDPSNFIAPFWDDLRDGGGTIYYELIGSPPEQQLVVQYDNWWTLSGEGPMKFEAILNETGEIMFQYHSLGSATSFEATVGIENQDGTDGLEYAYFDAAAIQPNLAILFTTDPIPYWVDLFPDYQDGFGSSSSSVDYTLTAENMGVNDDTYDLSSVSTWSLQFRDAGGGGQIFDIFVAAGTSEDFIARVQIPGSANPGDFNFADITATSQGDPSMEDSVEIRTQVPYNVNWQDGFEGGWDAWTTELINPGAPPTYWEIGDPFGWGPGTAFNGSNCAGTNINDDYYNWADICLISPHVQLGPGPQVLSFYQWYEMDTMGQEGGFVEISENGGPWTQIFPEGGYSYLGGFIGGYWVDAYSGVQSTWVEEEFDLGSYAGSVVQVRFHFAADNWAWQWGWGLDDVYIGDLPPYQFKMGPDFQSSYGLPTQDVDYIINVKNTGSSADTYDLSDLGLWPVVFRDIGDTMDITTLSVPAGNDDDFIARVTVSGGAAPGDIDLADITATSQGDPSKSETVQVQTQVPYGVNWFDGFESGWGAWSTEIFRPGVPMPTNWEIGDPGFSGPGLAYNGTNCSGTNIMDWYYPDADICLISPYVELASSGMQIFSFYHWYQMNTDGDDGGFVEISVDGGPWNQIWPPWGYSYPGGLYGGYSTDGYSGSTSGWEYDEFDLTSYGGSVVQIRFHFAASMMWGWQWGWYIDDVFIGDPPAYRARIYPDYQAYAGPPMTTVDYIVTLQNSGGKNDTYDLSSLSSWPVTFRDITDTVDIKSISLVSGATVDFIVRVSIPIVPYGAFDSAIINATSQNDTMVQVSAFVDTYVPFPAPFFDDMEFGPGPWQAWDNGMGTSWELGDPSVWPFGPLGTYSPTNCWGTNIISNYTTDAEAWLYSPFIDLRVAIDANMTFWHWYDINSGWSDGGWVEISDDYGDSWSTLDPVGGYPDWTTWGDPCYAGSSGGWVQAEFDLTGYLGEVVVFQFSFFDTSWDGPIERPGWYIDDVNVSATFVNYGVELTPDDAFETDADGSSVLYSMTATNLGTSGPDTFDLSAAPTLGWPVTIYDLGMNPITSIGPLATAASQDFYVQVGIPLLTPPMTQEQTFIIATSQNDPSLIPAEDVSLLATEVLAEILYVDDDGGIDTENEFGAALTAGGYDYNLWDYITYGPPDLAELNQHKAVIWATGNDYDDQVAYSLSPGDRTLIGNYLDGGGRFYLSGSIVGPDAWNAFGGMEMWTSWYNTYLHSDFVMLGNAFTPYSINGTPLSQIGDGLNLDGFSGDSNMNLFGVWCINDPINDGEPIFTEYTGGGTVAVKADTGIYRVVYTAFDLADVNGSANRSTLMDRIIQWLLLGDLPYVIETTPSDGAVGVLVDQDIIVVYSETMDTGTLPTLSQIGGPDPGGWTFSGWSSTYETDDTATWSHSNWAIGQDVNMSISGGIDLDANPSTGLLWNFSIDTGFTTATATGPTGGPTNVAGITITYGTTNSPATVDLYYTTDTGSPYTWTFLVTDNPADGSFGWTVPADGYYGWFAVSPDESAPLSSDSPEVSFYIYDGTPPVIQITVPLDMDTGVALNQDIIITFNEIMDPASVDGTVEPDPGGLIGAWSGGNTNFTLTHIDFLPNTRYWVNVTLGTDVAGNNLDPLPYSFYFDTVAGATTATATGPLGGPTNVGGINIFYVTTGSPPTVDLYYTTDLLAPFTWNLIGTDNPADGTFPWTVPADGSYGWTVVSPSESAPLSSDSPEASFYIFDGTAPNVDNTMPANLDIGVLVNQDVIITFNETMIQGSVTYSIEPNPGGLSQVWSGSDTIITISHTDFAQGTRYWVNITAGTDLAGNNLNPLPYSFYFDTVVGTTATATGPLGGPTNVAGITVLYNTVGAPLSVGLWYTTDTSAPYSWTNFGTDTPADGSFGWTIPADGDYGWFAQSPDESAPLTTDAPEASFYMYDGTQPQVSSTDPADLQPNIAINKMVLITFDEPMTTASVTYTIEPNPGGLFDLWSVGDTVISISHTDFLTSTKYWVNITAGTDLAGNNLNPIPYSFSFDTAATAAIATGPTSVGPTNVAGITITYNTVGAPASAGLWFTTDTSAPYSWTNFGTDTPADGTMGWTVPADGDYGWFAQSPDESAPGPSDSPEAFTYFYDGTSPEVSLTNPVDMATGVAITQAVMITFNETMIPGSVTYTIEPNPGGLSPGWGGIDTILTITHTDFAMGARYWVNVTAGTDLAGNNLNPLPDSFYFDTVTTATAIGPISVATNVAVITITYNTIGTPATVDLYYTTDTSAPYTWTFLVNDNPADGSFGWTIPADGRYGWFAVSPDESAPLSTDAPEASFYIFDGTPPEVSITTPLDLATGVLVTQDIIIIFNDTMIPGSVTYTIEPNPGGLSSGWSFIDTILTISHTDFAGGTRFWVNITAGTDLAGNNLNPLPFSFYFDTEIPDLTPPTVITRNPSGSGVVISSNFVITFNEAMNIASVEAAFSYSDGTTTWDITDGVASWNAGNTTMTFNPTADFAYSKAMTATINGSIAEDEAGNTLDGNANGTAEGSPTDDYTWPFTTESAPVVDTTPPVSSVDAQPTYQTSLTFDISYTASDSGSGVKEVELWYNLDGVGWNLYNTYTGGSRTISFTATSDGEYSFYTKAIDNKNNPEGTSGADTSTIVDATIPTIVSVTLSDPSPTNAGSLTITITFSEDMDTGIDPVVTFGLSSPYDTYNVIKSAYSGANWTGTITINPSTGDGQHTLTITLGQDPAGNQMAAYTMQFSIDTKQPSVSTGGPTGSSVPVNTAITITFNESMDKTSVQDAFELTDGTTTWTSENGTVSWSGNTMTFTPDDDLDYDTQYTVTIGTGARDLAGNTIASAYSWSFTTIPKPDTTAPSVSTVSHSGDDAEVSNKITITFNERMNHSKVEDAISVSPGMQIQSFSWLGNTLTITFTEDMDADTQYTASVGTGAEDEAGNALEQPYTWTFTPKEKEVEPSSDMTMLLILIIIIVVVVLLLLLMMKKKKPEQMPSDESGELSEDGSGDEDEFPEEEPLQEPSQEVPLEGSESNPENEDLPQEDRES